MTRDLKYGFPGLISDPQMAVKFMAKQHKYERLKDLRLGCVFRQLFGHAAGTASGEAHLTSAYEALLTGVTVQRACHSQWI